MYRVLSVEEILVKSWGRRHGLHVLRHYLRGEVLAEMSEWLRGRWVAIAGKRDGEQVFIRHRGPGKPLRVKSPDDLRRIITRYKGVVRTIYGSVNIYERLENDDDLDNPDNIIATTPSWDIDVTLDKWSYAVEAARIILRALESHGVSRSVYLIWSGEGIHIHVNENAFSEELRQQIHPFNAAYAVVEYVLLETRPSLIELSKKSGGVLKVENIMDVKRVFTAPLSFHRDRDLVAIVIPPEKLDSFDLSWAKPESMKHYPYAWKRYEPGEADNLAREAVKRLGLRYKLWRGLRTRKNVIVAEPGGQLLPSSGAGEKPRIGRFETMALLQAARYYVLTGDLDKAKSFGLNRAIFYAWAKYYGPSGRYGRVATSRPREVTEKRFVKVFEEEVPIGPNGYFEMGGKEQRPEDFDRQIRSRFEALMPWDQVWRKAVEYVSRFPRSVLRDPQRFYEEVYLPVRDNFVERILLGKQGHKGLSLLDFLGKKGTSKTRQENQQS